VLHQKRKGMRTMSQAMTKKSARLRVDMGWRDDTGLPWADCGGRVAAGVAIFVLLVPGF
jgi:hypothetical protein